MLNRIVRAVGCFFGRHPVEAWEVVGVRKIGDAGNALSAYLGGNVYRCRHCGRLI